MAVRKVTVDSSIDHLSPLHVKAASHVLRYYGIECAEIRVAISVGRLTTCVAVSYSIFMAFSCHCVSGSEGRLTSHFLILPTPDLIESLRKLEMRVVIEGAGTRLEMLRKIKKIWV